MAKVRKCLEIMESRVPQPKGKDNRKRKKSVEKPVAIEPVGAKEPIMKDEPPTKRKRGRPPKKADSAPANPESDDSAMDEEEEAPVEVPARPAAVVRSTSANKRAAKKQSSVTDIITKIEEQYVEVGRMYQEMGKTLALLKSTIGEDKANQEKTIRNEVREEFMAEMQKRISKK